MECNQFLGFKNHKLVTIILSKSNNEEDAINCDYYVTVDDPNHAETNLKNWIKSLE